MSDGKKKEKHEKAVVPTEKENEYKLQYLSATQMKMMLRCPRQYYYRYVLGIVIPPPWTWCMGSCGHAASKLNFTRKFTTHEDEPIDVLQDAYVTQFDDSKGEYVWEDEKKNKAKVKDDGVRVVKAWRENIAPPLMPMACAETNEAGEEIPKVEQKFELALGGVDYYILGYIDLETETSVDDMKFVGKIWHEAKAMNEVQPFVYLLKSLSEARAQLRADVEDGEPEIKEYPDPKPFRYHITTSAKKPKCQKIRYELSENNLAAFMHLIGEKATMIQKGIFPAVWEGYFCSEKSCGYYARCRGDMNGKVFIMESAPPRTELNEATGKEEELF